MCWTRYGTPTIGWRDGDRSALISGEEPAPGFFEMTGCVRRVEGEADSQTVVLSIGQAMNARFG